MSSDEEPYDASDDVYKRQKRSVDESEYDFEDEEVAKRKPKPIARVTPEERARKKIFDDLLKSLTKPPAVSLKVGKLGQKYWMGCGANGRPIYLEGITRFLNEFVFTTPESVPGREADVARPADFAKEVAQQTQPITGVVLGPEGLAGKTPQNGCMCYGMEHGILVHEQVQKLCMTYMNAVCNDRTPVVIDPKHTDRCALALYHFFREQRWIHVKNEHVVFDVAIGRATAIDMVFRSIDRQELVAVELKTGSDDLDIPVSPGAKFRFPLLGISDTPRNRYTAQVLMTMLILEMHMGQDKERWKGFDRYCIVHINPHTHAISCFDPADWIREDVLRKTLYDFALSMHQTKADQAAREAGYAPASVSAVTIASKRSKASSTSKPNNGASKKVVTQSLTTDSSEDMDCDSDETVDDW
jgi:hypothetical protein